MKPLVKPPFVPSTTAIDYVRNGKKPIVFMALGTMWSPPCRYTIQALLDTVKEEKYAEKIEVFCVDQDKDLEFCYQENFPVGFPTLVVFVNGYIAPFINDVQGFDPSKMESKPRLIRQCSAKQIKTIMDGAFEVLEGNAENIAFKE